MKVGEEEVEGGFDSSWEEEGGLCEEAVSYGMGQPFDLQERTARFGETVIRFCKKLGFNPVNNRIIDQLVGAATSIGANYCEATESLSTRDFRAIISRCVKETKEARHFLRMSATAVPPLASEARTHYREASELLKILGSMYKKK
jgi:four helix bundle protein